MRRPIGLVIVAMLVTGCGATPATRATDSFGAPIKHPTCPADLSGTFARSAAQVLPPDPKAMSEHRFWAIIDAHTDSDPDQVAAGVRRQLRTLSASDIEAFQRRYILTYDALVTWDHLDAVGIGLSGEAFDDDYLSAVDWIIGLGHTSYSRFLRDPDALAGFGEVDDGELLEDAADGAYRAVTGKDTLLQGKSDPMLEGVSPPGPVPDGSPVAQACRFPHLVAKYGAPTLRMKDALPSLGDPTPS